MPLQDMPQRPPPHPWVWVVGGSSSRLQDPKEVVFADWDRPQGFYISLGAQWWQLGSSRRRGATNDVGLIAAHVIPTQEPPPPRHKKKVQYQPRAQSTQVLKAYVESSKKSLEKIQGARASILFAFLLYRK